MKYSEALVIDGSEINRRIKAFQNELIKNNIDCAIILQNADIFYFTGVIVQGVLIINSDDSPYYLVKKNFDFACNNSNFENIIQIKNIREISSYIKKGSVIGFELDVVPFNTIKYYENLLSPSSIADISNLIKKVRAIKSETEISFIKKAALQLKIMCEKIKPFIKEGVKEYEIFAKIQEILSSNGHQGLMRMRGFNQEMFYGHVLSGKNGLLATYLDAPTNGLGLYPSFPQGASNNIVKNGDLISIDIVGCFNGYHADQTRPFAIGDIDKTFEEYFKKALEIQNQVISFIKPGVMWEDAYFKGLEIADKLGIKDIFMGDKFKVKFIGHGVGVEIDEFPFIAPGFKEKFEVGMVFALEPKIFVPEKGVVGIENTFVIRENGCEKLTTVEDRII